MNIVNKLTLRTLKENKRRTLVTIIGVIISVAMITAVATLVVSFMDLMQRQAIVDNGEWHVLYKDVNKEQLEALKKDEETQSVILSRDTGYAWLEGSQNEYKPYLFIKEYNSLGFEKYPVKLIEGRLPKSANELVISEHIEENGGVQYEIGDTLNLEVGERLVVDSDGKEHSADQTWSLTLVDGENTEKLVKTEEKSYQIVGVIERPTFEYSWAPGYTVLSYVDESIVSENETLHASVILKDIKRSLFQHTKELQEELGIQEVTFNHELLRYYGVVSDDNLNGVMISISSILMIVIMVGSISLIYNAFAISVSERSRYLGMLSSVGATKKQKRNSVFFEGAVIGAISIPIGIAAGLVGIGITLVYINQLLQDAMNTDVLLKMIVTPASILVAVIVSALTIFISSYIPAQRASRITAIDAIRQAKDIKLTGKKVKTSKFVRKVFGMEGEIGLKNLKRNKRRYQATVFSLAISVVLFLTVSYFTENLQRSYEMTRFGPTQDLMVRLDPENENRDNSEIIKQIVALEDVTEYMAMEDQYFQSYIDKSYIAESLQELVKEYPDMLEDGKFLYNINLYALDEQSLQAYAQQVGVKYEKIATGDHHPAIVVKLAKYQDYQKGQYVEEPATFLEEGQNIELESINWETNERNLIDTVEITVFADQPPMGVYAENAPDTLAVIVSEETFNDIAEGKQSVLEQSHYLYLKSNDPMKTEEEIKDMDLTGYSLYNSFASRESDKKMTTMVKVFIYGFITLITAITVANIFNTVSTSIALRKREFAMLKSVGMTPKSFNKMINYESIFYGIQSLLFGLPISFVVMYFLYKSFQGSFVYEFETPWVSILIVIFGVFIIVGSAMLYSSAKIKKENIIDALKQENI